MDIQRRQQTIVAITACVVIICITLKQREDRRRFWAEIQRTRRRGRGRRLHHLLTFSRGTFDLSQISDSNCEYLFRYEIDALFVVSD